MSVLQGKKAIVLGGTSGIGLATVNKLVAAGVTVVAASRRGKLDSPIDGVSVESIDVLDREALESFFVRHAPYDYLINCATGGARAVGPFLDMDMAGFQKAFAKLWGYTNSVRYGAPYLAENGAITLVSGSPARKMKPGYIAIATVGNAVEGFARSICQELAPKRINVVCPGLIDTPMFAQQGEARDTFFNDATSNHLIGRAGTAEEVASGIIFTLENEFITGTVVDIDGGAIVS